MIIIIWSATKALLDNGYTITFMLSQMYKTEKATAKEERPGASHDGIPQNSGSKTDLTVVLNAWYLAGFYTGK